MYIATKGKEREKNGTYKEESRHTDTFIMVSSLLYHNAEFLLPY